MSGKENLSVLEQHPFNSLNTSSSTPSKPSGTTRVIDLLHSEIDELKQSLETSQSKVKEYKQKYEVVTKRSTQIIENLTNTKHENDMMNSMLLRKERRIKDLEEQLTETMSKVDTMEFDQKSKEVRFQKLQENERKILGEHEVLKMSYDTLMRSQKEYKLYYDKEVSYLKSEFEKHLREREMILKQNIERFNSNDSELVEAFKKMTNKSNKLEVLYKQKNSAIVEALKLLALAAKEHGTKTIRVLNECEEVLKAANRKLPNFAEEEEQEEQEQEGEAVNEETQPKAEDSNDDIKDGKQLEANDVSETLDTKESSKESTPEPQVTATKDVEEPIFTPEPPTSLTLPSNLNQQLESRINVNKRGHSRQSSVNIQDNRRAGSNTQRRSPVSTSASSPTVESHHDKEASSPNLQRRMSNRRSSYQRKPSSNNETQNRRRSRVMSVNTPDTSLVDDTVTNAEETESTELDTSVDRETTPETEISLNTSKSSNNSSGNNRNRGNNNRRGAGGKRRGNNRNKRN